MNLRFPVAALAAASLAMGACGVGIDSYEDFRSALRSGAPCNELMDQRENFDDRATLDKIDADLEEIGCEDRDSERTDR
jgi:hypothetical protein